FTAQVPSNFTFIPVDRPLSAGCLVTGKCNLHCEFCYGNDESLPVAELNTGQWKEIFAKLRSWGLMRVDLSGGEPTIRKDINNIITAAMDAGLNVVLSTNGLILSESNLASLPPELRLHVSLDSGFPIVHERSRLRRNLIPSNDSFIKVVKF